MRLVVSSGFKSSPQIVHKGNPRGSVLGHLLLCYLLHINNIYFPTERCHVSFYADDTILYAIVSTKKQSFSRLQSAFVDPQTSFINSKLVVNSIKTTRMHVSRALTFHVPIPQWNPWNLINSVLHCKYLRIC